jgi:hypothetical protein
MQLTPLIAIHMTAAMGAVILGPFALWARMGVCAAPLAAPRHGLCLYDPDAARSCQCLFYC